MYREVCVPFHNALWRVAVKIVTDLQLEREPLFSEIRIHKAGFNRNPEKTM